MLTALPFALPYATSHASQSHQRCIFSLTRSRAVQEHTQITTLVGSFLTDPCARQEQQHRKIPSKCYYPCDIRHMIRCRQHINCCIEFHEAAKIVAHQWC